MTEKIFADQKITMDDVRIMIQKIQINLNYGRMTAKKKIKPKFTHERGHPAGYTDDLGIIADKNQWVEYRPSGWRSTIDPQDYMEMRKWCEQNLESGTWYTGIYYIFLKREEDVAWFMLRWS